MTEEQAIHVLIYQSPPYGEDDKKPAGEYKEHEVPHEDRMTVMRVLDYVFENCDRTLAYYKSCRIGKCTGCLVAVNGRNKLACTTLARDGMRIGPAKGHKIIRDLAIENSAEV